MKLPYSLVSASIFLLFTLFISSLSAQVTTFISIDSPASITGEYEVLGADFGPNLADGIQGTAVFAMDQQNPFNDGCSEYTTSVDGKICFIDKGTCEFGTKALNAENEGAIAVIICNTDPDVELTSMAPGSDGENVTIYTCMLSKQDCDILRLEIANNEIEMSIESIENPCTLPVDPSIVWGMNGEGSFDGGLGGWEATSEDDVDQVFTYIELPINQGALNGGDYKINSPTACNGAIIADFDFFTSGGDINVINSLSFPYPNYEGSIISPTIDLSNVENPSVIFYQFLLHLNGLTSFQYSIDNGNSWSAQEFIETDNVLTAAQISDEIVSEKIEVDIDNAAGESQVKLRFNYHNCDFYFWMLDDIIVLGDLVSKTKELTLGSNLIKVFPNPASDFIHIQLDEEMKGIVNLEVHSMDGQLIFSELVKSGKQFQINLGDQTAGIYMVSVSSGEKELTQRIILE